MTEAARMVVKGLSFIGSVDDSNAVQVDIKSGKISRIRPLHFDWKYAPEQFNPWKIEARGQSFERPYDAASGLLRTRMLDR